MTERSRVAKRRRYKKNTTFDYAKEDDGVLQYESNLLIQQLSSRNSQHSTQRRYKNSKFRNRDLDINTNRSPLALKENSSRKKKIEVI